MLTTSKIVKTLKKDFLLLKEKQEYHKQIKGRYIFYISALMISFVLLNLVAAFGVDLPVDILRLFSTTFLFIGLKIIHVSYNKNDEGFTMYYKNVFLPRVLERVYPNYEYHSREQGSKRILNRALGRKFTRFKVKGEDLIEGKTKEGWTFSLSELHRAEKSQQEAYTYLLYEIKLPYRFTASFYSAPQEERENLNLLLKKSYKMQDNQGNVYTIRTSNTAVAESVLNKEILDTICSFKRIFKNNNKIEFSLVEDSFYLIIPTIRNHLELSMDTVIKPERQSIRLINEFEKLCQPVHALVPMLKQRIGQMDKISLERLGGKAIENPKEVVVEETIELRNRDK